MFPAQRSARFLVTRSAAHAPLVLTVVAVLAGAAHGAAKYTIASRNDANALADKSAAVPALSASGRYVAFQSDAFNLAGENGANDSDAFVRDRRKNKTTRVSLASDGVEVDVVAYAPVLSANGRYACFTAYDDGMLAPGGKGTDYQVFVHDRKTKTTVRVSVNDAGTGANSSVNNHAFSGDGRYVAFATAASNLTADPWYNVSQVYVRDLKLGTTELVSRRVNGLPAAHDCEAPAISKDGRRVFFWSASSSLVPLDTNGQPDVFVRDRAAGTTQRVSLGENGAQIAMGANPQFAISANGRYLAFSASGAITSQGYVYSGAYRRDLETGAIVLASVRGDGQTFGAVYAMSMSASGHEIAFESDATDAVLDPQQNNGFLRDVFLWTSKKPYGRLVSLGKDGTGADSDSYGPALSPNGKVVAFSTKAADILAPEQSNVAQIVVVRTPK